MSQLGTVVFTGDNGFGEDKTYEAVLKTAPYNGMYIVLPNVAVHRITEISFQKRGSFKKTCLIKTKLTRNVFHLLQDRPSQDLVIRLLGCGAVSGREVIEQVRCECGKCSEFIYLNIHTFKEIKRAELQLISCVCPHQKSRQLRVVLRGMGYIACIE